MEETWWASHIWLIVLQILAFVPYAIGSWRFYKHKTPYVFWIILGIIGDVIVAIVASTGMLPRMNECDDVPWDSILFLIHIVTANIGMFGFLALVIYVLVKGKNRGYSKLRTFQYKVLLRLWCFGVCIALLNFAVKIAFNVRLYDLL